MRMARPKLRGPTIGFTLPEGLDVVFRRRAEDKGMSVGRYAGAMIERALSAQSGMVVVPHEGTGVRPEDAQGCEHVNRQPISGGLARCRDCGATRQMSGRWA